MGHITVTCAVQKGTVRCSICGLAHHDNEHGTACIPQTGTPDDIDELLMYELRETDAPFDEFRHLISDWGGKGAAAEASPVHFYRRP